MGSLYLNKLKNEERLELVTTLHKGQFGNCFICGKVIDLKLHANSIDIDHIEPTKLGGKDGPENFALTHESCNRSKQASDLRLARKLAIFDEISEKTASENRAPNLGDVLIYHGGAQYELPVDVTGAIFKTSFSAIGRNEVISSPIFCDELSGFQYTFGFLPIEYLHHDQQINPRAIGNNLKSLLEEFHRKLPQLHVSLAWISTKNEQSKVQVFDGQHKSAAQVLLGARNLPVRIFIDPDTDMLLTANTHAGTTLRQVAFDKSVQRSLGSSLLIDRMERYRKDCGRDESDESFTEKDLVNHFKGESREMKRFVLDWVRNSVTTHRDNKLRDYIDYGGRGTEMPLSYSTIEKTFYSFFIHGELLTTPFNFRVEQGINPRQLEIEQIVRLMNVVAEKIFIGQYDHAVGTRRIENNLQQGKDVDEKHLRAYRMAKEEILHNWLRYVKQIVQSYFITTGKPIDEKKLFQYLIPEACWDNIENFIDSLSRQSLWVNKDLSGSVFGGKRNHEFWQNIFESGKSPDGQQVMPKGLNVMDMIKSKISDH
jgi:hypothetical protein